MLQGNWLSTLCTELERKFDVRISDYARQLILQTAVAAEFDPHPAWRRAGALEAISRETIESLVEQELRALVENLRATDDHTVTYFHVLHWFERSDRLLSWPVSKE